MPEKPTLILKRSEIAGLMSTSDYVAALKAAFRCYATGDAEVPMPMYIRAAHGGFHAKGARGIGSALRRHKVNANFSSTSNARDFLPSKASLCCAMPRGSLLALMDSIEVTLQRTAAATVLAARFLAREEAACVAICGYGGQGRAQLTALAKVMSFTRALVWDMNTRTQQHLPTI